GVAAVDGERFRVFCQGARPELVPITDETEQSCHSWRNLSQSIRLGQGTWRSRGRRNREILLVRSCVGQCASRYGVWLFVRGDPFGSARETPGPRSPWVLVESSRFGPSAVRWRSRSLTSVESRLAKQHRFGLVREPGAKILGRAAVAAVRVPPSLPLGRL